MKAEQLHDFLRDVPDFPKPGILFKDITPLLRSPEALRTACAAAGAYATACLTAAQAERAGDALPRAQAAASTPAARPAAPPAPPAQPHHQHAP